VFSKVHALASLPSFFFSSTEERMLAYLITQTHTGVLLVLIKY